MEQWEIRPDPKASDPGRHTLLIKGGMKDVAAVIRKLGASCGRPSSSRVPKGYDFRLPLHRLEAGDMEKINSLLDGLLSRPKQTLASKIVPAAKPMADEPALAAAPVKRPLPPKPKEPPPISIPSAPPPEASSKGPPAPAESFIKVWHTRQKFDPRLNFESLLVGTYNRFAHAAASSVVGSPGTMYNPLFLYGPPGCGKSHLIQAVGGGLAQNLGDEQVIFSSGPRLSHAANIAVNRGDTGKLEVFFKTAKAMVIDDFHLLAVNAENQGFLARVFNHFLSRNLQVVLASLYAPRAVSALEEALKMSLRKGWSVDLKTPPAAVQLEIVRTFFAASGLTIEPSDINDLRGRVGEDYLEMIHWMRRVAGLIQTLNIDTKNGLRNYFDILFKTTTAPLPSSGEQMSSAGFAPPQAAAKSRGLAFVLTRQDEGMVSWMIDRFYAAARPLNLPPAYRHALTQIYDANQPFGAPFQIGEGCLSAGAQAALVVGPPQRSPLAGQSAEFSHAVLHVLKSLGLAAGWIAHSEAVTPQDFMRVHLDLLSSEP
ncbi:MAG: hypothetical protein A3J74_08965 [Elusimicrobia bacterium RIFCSPHIGHO2_02_FULL_57_9]|nr:MAG: hypothetical protein A3J74_08965 [Elusimicrobia bacterium RIFCSPHIGHO2_02_FULL_57_9]